MNNKKANILILCPYPKGTAPSQRFRFEQYLDHLNENNFTVTQSSFLNNSTWDILYKKGYLVKKGLGIIIGFLKRFLLLFTIGRFNYVFIHREASPIGPPVFEWIVAKLWRKKIIYDFDDAIWLPNTSKENSFAAKIKFHSKVKNICNWSYRVSCGNDYLRQFALTYNSNAVVVPTTIDINYHKTSTRSKRDSPLTIGWTGSHSTEKYLDQIIPVLKQLEEKYTFIFRVISNHNPKLDLKGYEYTPWSKHNEIEELSKFDIGVMPLTADKWSEGKCAFKGLQYMSLGIATIMSPVGVNKKLVQHGYNGFLADNEVDWIEHLSTLIEKEALRKELGKAGRQTIENHYSVHSQQQKYVKLFSE